MPTCKSEENAGAHCPSGGGWLIGLINETSTQEGIGAVVTVSSAGGKESMRRREETSGSLKWIEALAAE